MGTQRVKTGYLRFGIVAGVAGLVASSVIVWQASQAAFSGKSVNPANGWTAATVTMTDDDGSGPAGTAMFNNLTGLTPASAAQVNCIKVIYQGNKAAPVKLWSTDKLTGSLGSYLNLKIEIGAASGPGVFNNCGAFTPAATLFDATTPAATAGTLTAFNSTYTSYGTGLATGWTPSAANDYRVFRLTTTVADNNNANGQTCSYDFTWEAQA